MERLEKLCVQADERAKRAEGARRPSRRSCARRGATWNRSPADAGTPVKKKVEDDEVSASTRRAENEAAEAKLAQAEAKARRRSTRE